MKVNYEEFILQELLRTRYRSVTIDFGVDFRMQPVVVPALLLPMFRIKNSAYYWEFSKRTFSGSRSTKPFHLRGLFMSAGEFRNLIALYGLKTTSHFSSHGVSEINYRNQCVGFFDA